MNKITLQVEGNEAVLYWETILWKTTGKWFTPRLLRGLSRARSKEEADLLWHKLELQTAKEWAARCLGRKRLFFRELEHKLSVMGFSKEIRDSVLVFYKGLGVLDDLDLLERKKQKALAKGKGIKWAALSCKQWIEEENCSYHFSCEGEKESILAVMKKRGIKQSLQTLSWKEKNKLYLFLLQRGFAKDSILAAFQTWDQSAIPFTADDS